MRRLWRAVVVILSCFSTGAMMALCAPFLPLPDAGKEFDLLTQQIEQWKQESEQLKQETERVEEVQGQHDRIRSQLEQLQTEQYPDPLEYGVEQQRERAEQLRQIFQHLDHGKNPVSEPKLEELQQEFERVEGELKESQKGLHRLRNELEQLEKKHHPSLIAGAMILGPVE